MLTGEVELTDKDGKTGTYYLDTEGEDPAKDGLGSMQQGICEGKVFAPELKRNELVTLEFNDGSVDDYYADENGYAIWIKTQKVGDKTYLFGDDGTRVNAYLLSECRQHRISWKPHRISAGRPYRKLADSRFYLVSGRCRNWRTPFRLAKGRYSNLLYETRFL